MTSFVTQEFNTDLKLKPAKLATVQLAQACNKTGQNQAQI